MRKLANLRKNKKGFTLVELLVVLVIIAILAAAIIPTMLGFIDKAKEESAAGECRNVLIAANVVMNEAYGKGSLVNNSKLSSADVKTIAGVANEPGEIRVAVAVADGKCSIYSIASFLASNGKTYKYAAVGGWAVSTTTTP